MDGIQYTQSETKAAGRVKRAGGPHLDSELQFGHPWHSALLAALPP